MSDTGGGGKAGILVLALLVLGAGGFNYHRNWKAEQAVPRPFASYSAEDLARLIEAYESELAGLERTASRRGDTRVRDTAFGEGHREFERVRSASARSRALTGELAHREVRLRDLQEEQRRRAEDADALGVFLRRLTTL